MTFVAVAVLLLEMSKLTESRQVARLLIESGAEINARSDAEMTALINAAWRGSVEIVRLLVEKGADTNVQADSGSTVLEMSQYGGRNRMKIARILEEAGAKK